MTRHPQFRFCPMSPCRCGRFGLACAEFVQDRHRGRWCAGCGWNHAAHDSTPTPDGKPHPTSNGNDR